MHGDKETKNRAKVQPAIWAALWVLFTSALIALIIKVDVVGLVRLFTALRVKFGSIKAFVFACLMRLSFMPAWPESHAILAGAVRNEIDHFSFAPTASTLWKHDDVGLLFIPGALVEPEAYAPILQAVADASGATIVCARLPFRHPILFGADDAQRLMQEYPKVARWVIGGHSMGAGKYGAAGLLTTEVGANFSGLLMWAGTLTGDLDLSGERKLPCLALLASEDTVVPPDGKAEDGSLVMDGVTTRCPPGAKHAILQGGNHAGFAHYGPQRFPFADGERRITLEEQQAHAVQHTARFLMDI